MIIQGRTRLVREHSLARDFFQRGPRWFPHLGRKDSVRELARPHPNPLPQERTPRTFCAPCAAEPEAQPRFSPSPPAKEERAGERRIDLGCVVFSEQPLSPTLSPLVPRRERETDPHVVLQWKVHGQGTRCAESRNGEVGQGAREFLPLPGGEGRGGRCLLRLNRSGGGEGQDEGERGNHTDSRRISRRRRPMLNPSRGSKTMTAALVPNSMSNYR